MEFLIYLLVAYYLIVGLPALFSPQKTGKVLGMMMSKPELVRMMGIFLLIFAYLFLSNYRKLDGTRNMVISIIGRVALIKSVFCFRLPDFFNKKYKFFRSSNSRIIFIGIFTILASIFLLRVVQTKF